MATRPGGEYSDTRLHGPAQRAVIATDSLSRGNSQETLKEGNQIRFESEGSSYWRKKKRHPASNHDPESGRAQQTPRLPYSIVRGRSKNSTHPGKRNGARASPDRSVRKSRYDRIHSLDSAVSLAERYIPDRGSGSSRASSRPNTSQSSRSTENHTLGEPLKNFAQRASENGSSSNSKRLAPGVSSGANEGPIASRGENLTFKTSPALANPLDKATMSASPHQTWKEDHPLDRSFFGFVSKKESIENGERRPIGRFLGHMGNETPALRLTVPREPDVDQQDFTTSRSSFSSGNVMLSKEDSTPTSVTSAMSISSGSMPSNKSNVKAKKQPTCIMCKRSGIPLIDSLVQCNTCYIYYHTSCHNPKIIFRQENVSSSWTCHRCTTRLGRSDTSHSVSQRSSTVRKTPLRDRTYSSSEESLKEVSQEMFHESLQSSQPGIKGRSSRISLSKSATENGTKDALSHERSTDIPTKKRRVLPWTGSVPAEQRDQTRNKSHLLRPRSQRLAVEIWTGKRDPSLTPVVRPQEINSIRTPTTVKDSQEGVVAPLSTSGQKKHEWTQKTFEDSQPIVLGSADYEFASPAKEIAARPLLSHEVRNSQEDEVEQSLSDAPMSIDSAETVSPTLVSYPTQTRSRPSQSASSQTAQNSSVGPPFQHQRISLSPMDYNSNPRPYSSYMGRAPAPSQHHHQDRNDSPPYSPPPAEALSGYMPPPLLTTRTQYGTASGLDRIEDDDFGFTCSSCKTYTVNTRGNPARSLCNGCIAKERVPSSVKRPTKGVGTPSTFKDLPQSSIGSGHSRSPVSEQRSNRTAHRKPGPNHFEDDSRPQITPKTNRDTRNSAAEEQRLEKPKSRSEFVAERYNMGLIRLGEDTIGRGAGGGRTSDQMAGVKSSSKVNKLLMSDRAERKDPLFGNNAPRSIYKSSVASLLPPLATTSGQNSAFQVAKKKLVIKKTTGNRPAMKYAERDIQIISLSDDSEDSSKTDVDVNLSPQEVITLVKQFEGAQKKLARLEDRLQEQKTCTKNHTKRSSLLEKELEEERSKVEELTEALKTSSAVGSATLPSSSTFQADKNANLDHKEKLKDANCESTHNNALPEDNRKSVSLKELYKHLDFSSVTPFDEPVTEEPAQEDEVMTFRDRSWQKSRYTSLDLSRLNSIHVHRQLTRPHEPAVGESTQIIEDFSRKSGQTTSADSPIYPPPLGKGEPMTFEQFMGLPDNMVPFLYQGTLGFKQVVINQRRKCIERQARGIYYNMHVPGDLKTSFA